MSLPWLGERRGHLADWATQRWVHATGREIEAGEHAWLDGPVGSTRGIGSDFFDVLAHHDQLGLQSGGGLMRSFAALAGPEFDPGAVDRRIAHFYEHTSAYELDVWSQWSGAFRPFGGLLAALFSGRLQQLNVPLAPLSTSRGMSSRVVELSDPETGELLTTGWIRENRGSGDTIYVGAYSLAEVPMRESPCVKVVFPLPNGNATVLLKPTAEPDGSLLLESDGRGFGDAGFYFVVRARSRRAWVRHVRSFRESIRVYADEAGDLRTDHVFTLWRRPFLELHYRLVPG